MTKPIEPKNINRKKSTLPGMVIVLWLIIAVGAILALKFITDQNKGALAGENTIPEGDLPEALLAKALVEGKPIVAFYHSNSCDSCIQMIEVVQQVYGEFVNSVVLVDVNVYEPTNTPLLEKERINYIPTLVFYDASGEKKPIVGVLLPETLRAELLRISGGK